MLHNGGNTGGLFRGAFMQSGFPLPVGSIEQGQRYYDFTVQFVGCSTANDTLECLRSAPFDQLQAAFDSIPSLFSYQVCANSRS
jgi:carboxylesterase type B